ncbi:MAG: inorganic phosphate transporter, partial [Sediminibacterium sp.]|nr:inorganic phosphate transporter [Sediminibacterium sp.]
MTTALILIIVFCIVFDYINGFHDAANSIATVVSTKVLTPFQAVCWAALFNFVAFFIFKEAKIAETIAKTVDFSKVEISNLHKYIIIISGLSAAIFWNLLTWWFGIPSSSSHTLYGGFIGAAVTAIGFQSINSDFVILTLGFIVLAPLMGMVLSITISLITIQNNFYKKSIIW